MKGYLKAALAAGALVGAVALAQAAYSFTINGKATKLETVERNGRVFVDAEVFAKALGASVTWNKGNRSFVIVSGSGTAATVQGTTQVAGDNGQLGKTYTLGKDSPLNFTLKSAEYTVTRVNIGDAIAPKADEKLLVLHYTVQNPQKGEVGYGWSGLRFSAIDASDVTRQYIQNVAREGTGESLNVSLKPAQKIDAFTVIVVPAAGVVPKLIVERGDGSPVLRFDLRGKVKGLPAPIADPADATGATARTEVPAEMGKYYPLQRYDVRLDSVTYTTNPLGGRAPEQGKRYLVATVSVKNGAKQDQGFGWSTVQPGLKDADGEKVDWNQTALKASRDEAANTTVKPGEEYKARYFFELPQDVNGKTLTLKDGESRSYSFDISTAK